MNLFSFCPNELIASIVMVHYAKCLTFITWHDRIGQNLKGGALCQHLFVAVDQEKQSRTLPTRRSQTTTGNVPKAVRQYVRLADWKVHPCLGFISLPCMDNPANSMDS